MASILERLALLENRHKFVKWFAFQSLIESLTDDELETFARIGTLPNPIPTRPSPLAKLETRSTDFPTMNALQAANAGGGGDGFVAKVTPTGSALVYSTYLGGSGYDAGQGIAVDNSGDVYVTGLTASTDFPTMNPLQPMYGGGSYDAFVSELNPTGSALVYSTYLGGSGARQLLRDSSRAS